MNEEKKPKKKGKKGLIILACVAGFFLVVFIQQQIGRLARSVHTPPPSEAPATVSALPSETPTPTPSVEPSAEPSVEASPTPTPEPSTPPLPENPQGDITQYFTDDYSEIRSVKAVDNDGKSVIIFNTKIDYSLTNKLTIEKAFFDVAALIKNQGADRFDELQYWALGDTRDGDEIKVISFTLDSDLIKAVYNDNVLPIEMADYVSDLYIHPALQD